ncbi:MAG: helix-turn-helix domain-containing protein [Candidatus Thermoplasmatota archaeon]|nr:helix-turn-helix domain-containing protein [Candidatus Thermoplasmatota archaeon]
MSAPQGSTGGDGSNRGGHGGSGQFGFISIPQFVIPSITEKTYAAFGIASILGAAIASLVAGRICYVDSTRILLDENRRKIFGMIKEKPGIYLTQICVELNSNTTRALWHLRKLQGAGLIKTDKLKGKRTYYPLICESGN